jgi:hypothetical protein
MTIYGLNLDGLGVDSRQAKMQRTLIGALYGLLGGAAFACVAAFVDLWLNPELPLGVNWSAFWVRLPLLGVGLALIGAVACWWHEAWRGLLGGTIVASALTLLSALFTAQVGTGLKVIVLVVSLVPVAVLTLPVAYLLRWVTEQHAQALRQPRRELRLAGLLLAILLLGAGGGYLTKASTSTLRALRSVDGLLQTSLSKQNPLSAVAGVRERAELPYTLYATRSAASTEGYEVHIQFEDRYRVSCTVVVYPGQSPFLKACRPASAATP